MGKGFKHGGSIVSKGNISIDGLKVIACSSFEELPKIEDENTIAVITDVEISGYRFMTNDLLMERSSVRTRIIPNGYVEIRIGNIRQSSCDMNIGGISFCPIVAYQYIDGEIAGESICRPRTAYVRKGSFWKDWFTYLYGGDYDKHSGRDYPDLTGGWTGTKDDDDNNYSLGSFTASTNISITSTKNTAIYAHTVNVIDLTDVKTISVDVSSVTGSPFVSIHAEGDSFNAGGRSKWETIRNTGTVTLDVSGLTQNYCIAIGAFGGNHSCTVTDVYMQYGEQNGSDNNRPKG